MNLSRLFRIASVLIAVGCMGLVYGAAFASAPAMIDRSSAFMLFGLSILAAVFVGWCQIAGTK